MKTKITITVYFFLLAMIVYAANQGTLPKYLSFYREIPGGDALGHFILMGIFSFLATIISLKQRLTLARILIPVGPVLVFLIVLAEEISQIFIATRTFSLIDLAADLLGIITFAWLGLRFNKRSSVEFAAKMPAGD